MSDNINQLADALGELKAEKEALEAKIKEIQNTLIEYGETVEGERYVATFIDSQVRWYLDKKSVEADMGEAWTMKHSKPVNVSPSIRVKHKL